MALSAQAPSARACARDDVTLLLETSALGCGLTGYDVRRVDLTYAAVTEAGVAPTSGRRG